MIQNQILQSLSNHPENTTINNTMLNNPIDTLKIQLTNNGVVLPSQDEVKQMYNIVKFSGNPKMMMFEMMKTNPSFKQFMNITKQLGGSKQLVMALTDNNMGNVNGVLNTLNG